MQKKTRRFDENGAFLLSDTWQVDAIRLRWTHSARKQSVNDPAYLFLMAACAAAKRAIGTRNGEQET